MKTQNQTQTQAQTQILEAIGKLSPKHIETLKAIIEEQHPTPNPIWFSPTVHFKKWHTDAWTIEIESIDSNGGLIIDTNFTGNFGECYAERLYLDKTTCQDTLQATFTLFHFTVQKREFEKLAEVTYTETEQDNWEEDLMHQIKKFFKA